LARREGRLAKLAAAQATIEARAKERFAHEQAEYQAKLAARQARAEKTGKKPRGKPPEPPAAGPRATDQINLTDDESRIMPVLAIWFPPKFEPRRVSTARYWPRRSR
jgi:hypothetical protein